MAKNKTIETSGSVPDFIGTIKDETKRRDCITLIDLMKKQTGQKPKM